MPRIINSTVFSSTCDLGKQLFLVHCSSRVRRLRRIRLVSLVSSRPPSRLFPRSSLPSSLSLPFPPTYPGILHIYYTALLFLFFRVFMRISYSLPPHLQFSLDVLTWTELVEDSRQAIEWLDRNDHALDTMFLVSYATTSVALVQVSFGVGGWMRGGGW